jgi:hypothetical protein
MVPDPRLHVTVTDSGGYFKLPDLKPGSWRFYLYDERGRIHGFVANSDKGELVSRVWQLLVHRGENDVGSISITSKFK